MNISHFLLGPFILCSLPSFCLAQPEERPNPNVRPFPKVTPEEVVRIVLPTNPVSLHLRNVSLKDALDELQKQSDIKIDSSGDGGGALKKELSIDIETHSFQEAFDALLEAANVKGRLRQTGGRGYLILMFGETNDESASASSGKFPFIVHAKRLTISSSRSVTTGPQPTLNQNSSLGVSLDNDIDPQISIIGMPRLHITRADDEHGRSLQIEEQHFPTEFDSGWWSSNIDVRLKTPTPGSKNLAHLEGTLTYVIPVKYEKWEITDVLNAPNSFHDFRSNGRTIRVTIVGARLVGSRIQIDMEANSLQVLGGPNPLLSSAQLVPAIRLKAASGQESASSGYVSSGGEGKMTIQATFGFPTQIPLLVDKGAVPGALQPPPQIHGPISFSMDAPVEFIQTEVPFSFSNLPLP